MNNNDRKYYRHLSRKDWNKIRNLDNAQNKQLSDNQHRALSIMAHMRHEFHCSISGIAENKECERYKKFFFDFLPVMLRANGLPELNIVDAAEKCGYDNFEELFNDNKKKGNSYQKANTRRAEWLNQIIEDYLHSIDAYFGTWYAPSGTARSTRHK